MRKGSRLLVLSLWAIVAAVSAGCTVETSTSGRTCNIANESCSSSLDCCGPGFCVGGSCDSNSYLSAGSSCSRSVECRGALFCTSGRCQ